MLRNAGTKEPSCGGLEGWGGGGKGRVFTLMPFWGERPNGECVGNGYGEEVFGVNMIFLSRSRREIEVEKERRIGFLFMDFGGDATYRARVHRVFVVGH